MDVTRKTFFDLLPELEEAIEKALFISIDGEFTGIDDGSALSRNTPYDPPHEVYNRHFQKAMDFLLVQFGMCIFYYDDESQKYTHQAYNFYVFPQSNNYYEPDPIFKCQSSSLAFLAFEGFDFNKLFREGIPYLNENEEQRRRKALQDKWKAIRKPQNKVPTDMPVPKEKQEYLKDVCNKVKRFLEGDSDSGHLTLDPCNSYLRKFVYQEIEKMFGELVCLRTDPNRKDNCMKNDRGILVFRGEDKERINLYDDETEKQENLELESAVGFSHVIKLLSKSGKLIVGHNMLLDVCHTLNRFVCSIPESYDLFKGLLHGTFPRMIDTKTMTSMPPFQKYFQSTVLQSVLETVASDPFKIPECEVRVPGRGYSTLKAKEHEAGYDAYITGLCYLALCGFLNKGGRDGRKADEIAHEFFNKVYVWVLDAPYIHIGEEDPKPSRQHVFHLEYAHEWKRNSIAKMFKSVGPVNISFLSETRAYVALIHKQNASMVTNVKGGVVTRYDTYHLNHSNRDAYDDNATPKKGHQGKKPKSQNAVTLNEKKSPTSDGSSSGNKSFSTSKKRSSKDKNNDDGDYSPPDIGIAVPRKSSGDSLKDADLRGSADCEMVAGDKDEPPPSKIRKEFDLNDDWD